MIINIMIMKKQLLLFLSMLLPLAASADVVEIDGIYYNIIEKTKIAEVAANPNKYSGDIVIPEKIYHEEETYTVNSIGSLAFNCCYDMTSIKIPASIVSIDYSAFSNCIGLTSVYITDLEAWCKISYGMISPNPLEYAHHLFLNGEEVKELVIPNNVSIIAKNTFSGCSGLTSLTIPSNVTAIGDAAFMGCSGLKSLIIPSSVTSLGVSAFSNCTGLISVELPSSITMIGIGAFSHCTNLTTITIPSSVTDIGSDVFNRCSSLKTIIIGSGIKTIGYFAFANCAELTDVYCYAESVPTTKSDAFEGSYIGSATLHVPSSSMNLYKTTAPWSDFKEIVSISGETLEKCATPTISFKGSKLHFECETPDVTYHYTITPPSKTDNTGNDVEVGSSYTVQVYASKDGYLDSDTATQDIDIRGLKGDVNGDGEVTAQDASLILQKVAGK